MTALTAAALGDSGGTARELAKKDMSWLCGCWEVEPSVGTLIRRWLPLPGEGGTLPLGAAPPPSRVWLVGDGSTGMGQSSVVSDMEVGPGLLE